MTALPGDYDTDPERFLANAGKQQEDVHPYVAERLAAAGARLVLDVGGGYGRLARLLPDLGIRCLLIDMSPTMLKLAPRPAVRADGACLPVADDAVDAVAALYTLYHYDDPVLPLREARRVLRRGGMLAACAPDRDSAIELADVLPGWGAASTFDGEDAPQIVAGVFGGTDDLVEVVRWDGPLVTLASTQDAAVFLRSQCMSAQSAAAVAATLALPMSLTMRGCFVYATKG